MYNVCLISHKQTDLVSTKFKLCINQNDFLIPQSVNIFFIRWTSEVTVVLKFN